MKRTQWKSGGTKMQGKKQKRLTSTLFRTQKNRKEKPRRRWPLAKKVWRNTKKAPESENNGDKENAIRKSRKKS